MNTTSAKPNIVFVITDDQGYGDLGCHGNPVIQTPNLDHFHRQSVHFTNFHVGPTCAPTRAGLMTGHYANSTGVWHTVGGRSLLRKDEWSLASALSENGYRTGIFGKWHLGDMYPYRPQDRGFDTVVVHGGGGISQTPDYWGNDYFDDTYRVNGELKAFEGYCTDVFFQEALKFIEANKERPFFCFIPTNAPHLPYNVDCRYSDPYQGKVPELRASFYGMISNIDENFGRLRSKLQEWQLEDNTILIFMTDNGTSGGASFDGNKFVKEGYNAGLRGGKGSSYDGGHRVPFFLRWPAGGLDNAKDIDVLTANVDFMPTLLDLCNIPVPEDKAFHGSSLLPLLNGDSRNWPDRAMVTDSQRVTHPVKWRQSSVMTNRWRLIDGKELYDIFEDREQRHEVSSLYPDVVRRLREEYEKWWDIVSCQFDQEIPISIGSGKVEETCLICHDWRNEECVAPSSQAMIRGGIEANGYWELEVESAGQYRIELRRWPREANRPISAGIDGDDVHWRKDAVPEKFWEWYTCGKALPVTKARLKAGDQESFCPVEKETTNVLFSVKLPKGATHLQTWLYDETGSSVGAYYVYVRLEAKEGL